MDDLIKRTREAFFKAVERVGGRLVRLQEKTGVNYTSINRLNSGKNKFKDLSLQTLIKLFPEMAIYFFRDEYPDTADHISPGAKKIVDIYENLDEEGRVHLLTEAGAIRERHEKNKPRELPKTG